MSEKKKIKRPGAGRTKGAISLVAVKFQDLLDLLGKDYNGDVVISIKWLESIRDASEFRVVKVGDESPLKEKIDLKSPAPLNEKRPKFVIDEP